jgi:hypothetical protein
MIEATAHMPNASSPVSSPAPHFVSAPAESKTQWLGWLAAFLLLLTWTAVLCVFAVAYPPLEDGFVLPLTLVAFGALLPLPFVLDRSITGRKFDRGDAAAAATVLFAATTVVFLWLFSRGYIFIDYIGESHSIYLSAANTRNFITLILQDAAPSPDPAAHPFLYIHHPNLPPRLFSMALQKPGVGVPGQMLIMSMISCLALIIGYLALRQTFGRWPAVAAIAFMASNYWFFYSNAGDILRATHLVTFWVALYLLVVVWPRHPRMGAELLAYLTAITFLGDWGFYVFLVSFAGIWLFIFEPQIPWRRYLLVFALPTVIALGFYLLVIIHAVGWGTFLLDARLTLIGKLGYAQGLDADQVAAILQERNIVFWSGSNMELPLGRLLEAFTQGTQKVLGVPTAWPIFAFMGGCIGLIFIASPGLAWLRATCAVIVLLCLLTALPLQFVALAIVGLAIAARRLRLAEDAAGDRRASSPRFLATVLWTFCAASAFLMLGAVFPYYFHYLVSTLKPPMLLIELGAVMAFAMLIEKCAAATGRGRLSTARDIGDAAIDSIRRGLRWTVRTGYSTQRELDVVDRLLRSLFARLHKLMWRVAAWIRRSRIRAGRFISRLARAEAAAKDEPKDLTADPTALQHPHMMTLPLSNRRTLLVTVAVLKHEGDRLSLRASLLGLAALCVILIHNVKVFASMPPMGPPYAAVLAEPQFRGASFFTSSYDGLAWYYTRGWTTMVSANPPSANTNIRRFRHFADWRDEAKYSRPQYFLCDRSPYFGWHLPTIPKEYCPQAQPCDCREVATFMRSQGHDPVVVQPTFAIIRYRYAD